MLRIDFNQWHLYACLAILNPAARTQIDQFAKSVAELFKLVLSRETGRFGGRVYWVRVWVFRWAGEDWEADGVGEGRTPIFLSGDILDRFSLGRPFPYNPTPTCLADPDPKANSHLNIQPRHHLTLVTTPIFRLWLSVAEYLFRSRTRPEAALAAAPTDTSHCADDLEFVVAAEPVRSVRELRAL